MTGETGIKCCVNAIRAILCLDPIAWRTILIPEIELYEALVGAGVSKDKAHDVVLAHKEAMDQFLTTLATKADLTTLATKADLADTKADLMQFRTYVDGRFNLVAEQMVSMTNKIVVRLGALMVVLIGLLGTLLALMHR